jgi:hypothetical protein
MASQSAPETALEGALEFEANDHTDEVAANASAAASAAPFAPGTTAGDADAPGETGAPEAKQDDDSDGSAASVTSLLDLPSSPRDDEVRGNSPGVMKLARSIETAETAEPESGQARLSEQMRMPSGYPAQAASYFGEYGAHRLRWAHAVNGQRRLRAALNTAANFLEADVVSGKMVYKDEMPMKGQEAENGLDTIVKTASGQSVIMAHYPTELSSDLSFEAFIDTVLRHNDRVRLQASAEKTAAAAAAAANGHGHAPSCGSEAPPSLLPASSLRQEGARQASSTSEEAAKFCREIDNELDQANAQGSAIASCVGSRRDHAPGRNFGPQLTLKGIKLDFKRFDCVAPCIEHLRSLDAAKKLGGHLWLNADVFAGPGALLTPFDAKQFVRLCAESLPEAVLSLSWGASMLSTMKSYSSEMVDHMIELCMTPIVPRALPRPASSNGNLAEQGDTGGETGDHDSSSSDRGDGAIRTLRVPGDGEMYFTPAAVCSHITFAVAVEYAQLSADKLSRLLDAVPGSSLTLFSGYGSVGVSPLHVKELINSYGTTRLFLDLKLSKAWRSCGVKGVCSLQ